MSSSVRDLKKRVRWIGASVFAFEILIPCIHVAHHSGIWDISTPHLIVAAVYLIISIIIAYLAKDIATHVHRIAEAYGAHCA